MDESQVAPPVESPVPQPVAAPPPPEQSAQTQAPENEAPTTDAGLMRAFTQSQQKLSAVAAALGIAKTSTSEQFVAAINERKRVLAQADAALEDDPRLAARAAELRAREERIAQQQYGESAALASTLVDAARNATSLLELAEIVDQALIENASRRFAGAAPAPQQQEGSPPQATGARERNLIGQMPSAPNGSQTPQDKPKDPQDFFSRLLGRA